MIRFCDGTEVGSLDALGMAKLEIACKWFTSLSGEGVYAKIKDTWLDYGARLWYKQIVIYRGSESDSFQISPNDREAIVCADSEAMIVAAVCDAMLEYPKLFGLREERR